MTEETALIWRRMREAKQATIPEMIGWTGRPRHAAIITVRLMIRAGQLRVIRRGDVDSRAVYGLGVFSTFDLRDP